MKALILKDLYMLRLNILVLIGVSIIAIIISSAIPIPIGAGLTFPIMLFAVMNLGNLITLDHQFRWERIACTLPIKTEKLILCKYILSAMIAIFSASIIIIIMYISANDTTDYMLPLGSLIVGSIFIMASIIFPVSIRFGGAKGSILLVFILLIPWLLSILFMDEPVVNQFFHDPGEYLKLTYLYLGCAVLLFIVSFFISVVFYKKRDW